MCILCVFAHSFFVFQQPSSNYDDSGFFSIQVLQEALQVWGLELVPFTSQHLAAQDARRDPTSVVTNSNMGATSFCF